jgi:hypothetical protein
MSLRVLACYLYVFGFAAYTRRNWFISLCAVVWLMAVNQHPDMPRSIGGIQGLNLWNVLMFSVLVAWRANRRTEGLAWDLPTGVAWLFGLYAVEMLIGSLRYFFNPGGWGQQTAGYVLSEYFINCFKWMLPGLILFDACRTRKRVLLGVVSILAYYFLLALQVIKHVPFSYAVSSSFGRESYKLIQNSIGYNRVTLSMMLGGACWAILSTLVLVHKRKHQYMVLGIAALVALAQALTGGRSGYVSWLLVGLILCVVRWRRLLPVIPIVVLAVLICLPGIRQRVFQGFEGTRGNIVIQEDQTKMTSGRNIAWPYVIQKICQSPLVGYGREGMITAGVYRKILDDFPDEDFAHPHNAYLEALLDGGVISLGCVLLWFLFVLRNSFRLLLDREDPLCCAIGGVTCSLVLALMVAAMGGQTFYPREGSVGMWAAIGLMLRVSLERASSRKTGAPLFAESDQESPEEDMAGLGEERPVA